MSDIPAPTVDRRRVGIFYGSLIGFATLVIVLGAITDVRVRDLAPIYMFTPAIAAIIVVWASALGRSELGMRVGRPGGSVVAAFVALPLLGVMLLVAVLLPGIDLATGADPLPGLPIPSGWGGLPFVLGVVIATGLTINAIFALGEELGWRGYLLWELAPLGFWPASAVIGLSWGIWHAPIIVDGYNFPSFPVLGVAVMVLACLVFSPLYVYLTLRARSVLAAAFLHGVFNAGGGLVVVYTRSDGAFLEEIVASPVGLIAIATFAAVAIGLALADTPVLARDALTDGR